MENSTYRYLGALIGLIGIILIVYSSFILMESVESDIEFEEIKNRSNLYAITGVILCIIGSVFMLIGKLRGKDHPILNRIFGCENL